MNATWVKQYVPAHAAGRTFAFTALVDSVGTGLYLAGSAIFFVRTIGLTSAQVGVGLAVAGCAGLLATVPLGAVGDRYGARRTLVLLQLWRAVCFTALAFVNGPVAFVAVSVMLGAAEAAVPPLTQAVVASTTQDGDRVRTLAIVRTVRNVGFSLGALSAVPLLATDSVWTYRAIVLGDAVTFVLAAGMLARIRLIRRIEPERATSVLRTVRGFRDWRYLRLAGLNGVLSLHMTILSVGIPLWTIQSTEAPAGAVPVTVIVNTVLAVVLQVPFSRLAETLDGSRRALRLAGLALGGCCIALAAAGRAGPWTATALLLGATVLMTLGELWQAVGSWELSYRYAPEDLRGTYLSVFSLGPALQEICGPLLITAGAIKAGPYGWGVLGVVLCLTGAVSARVSAPKARPVPTSGGA